MRYFDSEAFLKTIKKQIDLRKNPDCPDATPICSKGRLFPPDVFVIGKAGRDLKWLVWYKHILFAAHNRINTNLRIVNKLKGPSQTASQLEAILYAIVAEGLGIEEEINNHVWENYPLHSGNTFTFTKSWEIISRNIPSAYPRGYLYKHPNFGEVPYFAEELAGLIVSTGFVRVFDDPELLIAPFFPGFQPQSFSE